MMNVRQNKFGASQDPFSVIMRTLTWIAATLVMLCFAGVVIYTLIKGIPHISPSLFAWTFTTDNVSLMPALINTLLVALIALVAAVPFGIGGAIYLCEYARPGSMVSKIMGWAAETLNGIPSVVFGLFGAMFFVRFLHMGLSILAGGLTLALMILPLILRTTQEALLEVDQSLREASFGLGAGKLRTIFRIVLPSAIPGILSGIILALGRITGESAALIFTAGTVPEITKNMLDSGRTLAVHMYSLSSEGLYLDQTWATAVILIILVALLNLAANRAAAYLERKTGNG